MLVLARALKLVGDPNRFAELRNSGERPEPREAPGSDFDDFRALIFALGKLTYLEARTAILIPGFALFSSKVSQSADTTPCALGTVDWDT